MWLSTHGAVELLKSYGIDADKITVGYPSYSRGLSGVQEAKLNTPFTDVDLDANLDMYNIS